MSCMFDRIDAWQETRISFLPHVFRELPQNVEEDLDHCLHGVNCAQFETDETWDHEVISAKVEKLLMPKTKRWLKSWKLID